MPNGSSILSELSRIIADLRREREGIQKKLAEVDYAIEAVEVTMNLYRKTGIIHEPAAYKTLALELQGKTQLQALIHIASKTNGRLKVVDAKRVMLEAGLIRNPKTALSMLYTVINRSGKFEKTSPGKYRLVTPEQTQFPR